MPVLTPLLDTVKNVADIRQFDDESLKTLAHEVREELIDAVSQTGGHLGASLGVVELTVALHHVFQSPEDKIIFDVGHQAYPHKILTGRRETLRTIRQENGLSGFTKRSESPHDPFGAGHSSTSISAGLGMATARDLKGEHYHVVSVIGDGAMSAGLAFEALNNAGHQKTRLIVILNDNDMSIAPPTGALSHYLTKLWSGNSYGQFRKTVKSLTQKLPSGIERLAKRVEEYSKGMAVGGTLFEELGFQYFGPVDGHDLDQLLPVLRNLRDGATGPVLLHCVTQKGYGYKPAEESADRFHGVSAFDKDTGTAIKKKSNSPSYTRIFADSLVHEAHRDPAIVAVTAAMPSGTGLDIFGRHFPDRVFDVGIAEQHAVTFSAGLASEGMKPFCAIYSTFLQRGFDQIVHDVAIQKLPVRFAIDRAGFVGADGATHAGSFDISFMSCLPNMIVMAPSDEAELQRMVLTSTLMDDQPISFRFPRGEGPGVELDPAPLPLEIGKGRLCASGEGVAVISFGGRLTAVEMAAKKLEQEKGQRITIMDARFAKPLDVNLITQLAREHHSILTVEEGSCGGFGDAVNRLLLTRGLLDSGKLRVRNAHFSDQFFDHASPEVQYAWNQLDAEGLYQRISEMSD